MDNQEFSQSMTHQDTVIPTMEYFISQACKESMDEGHIGPAEIIKNLYKSNIDYIFQYSGSVIETVFLNSLILGFIKCSPSCLFVTPPIKKGTKELKDRRVWVKEFIKGYSQTKNKMVASGIDEVSGFKSFIEWQCSQEEFNEEEKQFWLSQCLMHQAFDVHNSFHLTLQPYFPEIKPEGKNGIRPDFLIWIPNKPKFNLIVECDGYEWHADKTTFDKDRRRDRYLKQKGFDVLRYSGREIMNDPVGSSTNLLEHLEIINPKSFQ